jgi:hypothetical protein
MERKSHSETEEDDLFVAVRDPENREDAETDDGNWHPENVSAFRQQAMSSRQRGGRGSLAVGHESEPDGEKQPKDDTDLAQACRRVRPSVQQRVPDAGYEGDPRLLETPGLGAKRVARALEGRIDEVPCVPVAHRDFIWIKREVKRGVDGAGENGQREYR